MLVVSLCVYFGYVGLCVVVIGLVCHVFSFDLLGLCLMLLCLGYFDLYLVGNCTLVTLVCGLIDVLDFGEFSF